MRASTVREYKECARLRPFRKSGHLFGNKKTKTETACVSVFVFHRGSLLDWRYRESIDVNIEVVVDADACNTRAA